MLSLAALVFSISPPPSAEVIAPSVVHWLRAADGGVPMQGADGARLLTDGELLVWGDGEELTSRAFTRLNPLTGRRTQLHTAKQQWRVVPTGDDRCAWFFTTLPEEVLWWLDLATGTAVRASTLYGDDFKYIEAALMKDRCVETKTESDGTLVIEWSRYEEIPFLFGKSRSEWGLRSNAEIDASPNGSARR